MRGKIVLTARGVRFRARRMQHRMAGMGDVSRAGNAITNAAE